VVISGNRAISAISIESLRFVGIDGRLSDLESDAPAHLMPLTSDHWGTHFRWEGQGPLPADQRERLQAIVRRVHAAGRRVRFWATPENPTVWKELWQADIDLINTDQLAALREFLLTQPQGN
jgi:hypothetical protein